jgi:hypothetical protein
VPRKDRARRKERGGWGLRGGYRSFVLYSAVGVGGREEDIGALYYTLRVDSCFLYPTDLILVDLAMLGGSLPCTMNRVLESSEYRPVPALRKQRAAME